MSTISQPKDPNCKICTFHLDQQQQKTIQQHPHSGFILVTIVSLSLSIFEMKNNGWSTSNLFQFISIAWDAWSFFRQTCAFEIETNRLSQRLGKVIIYGPIGFIMSLKFIEILSHGHMWSTENLGSPVYFFHRWFSSSCIAIPSNASNDENIAVIWDKIRICCQNIIW